MIKCFGLIFRGLTKESLLEASEGMKFIVTVNSEFIVRANTDQPRLKQIINSHTATFDGQVPYLLGRVIHPKVHVEKISGSDFFYDLCRYANTYSLKIFLLGGRNASNEGAVDYARKKLNVVASGYSPPFEEYPFSQKNSSDISAALTRFQPDILMVGFGAVKQEYWIDDNYEFLSQLGVKFVVGVGGTFDFVSGGIDRAPIFIQKACLEGVYRFVKEPKLFRFRRLVKSLGVFKYWIDDLLRLTGNRRQ